MAPEHCGQATVLTVELWAFLQEIQIQGSSHTFAPSATQLDGETLINSAGHSTRTVQWCTGVRAASQMLSRVLPAMEKVSNSFGGAMPELLRSHLLCEKIRQMSILTLLRE